MRRFDSESGRAIVSLLALLPSVACSSEVNDAPVVFASDVVEFSPGEGAGYGQDRLPAIVQGPPVGGQPMMGSIDVLSLGRGGTITLELARPVDDEPGVDLIVFENAFYYGNSDVFAEPGFVEVSSNGETFVAFDCKPEQPAPNGCAGMTPRLGDDPSWQSELVGGDAFDLSQIGFDAPVRFVRITDASSMEAVGTTAGFDLDAVLGFVSP